MSSEVVAALAGAVVGGGVSFLGQLLLDWWRRKQREHNLAASIRAELVAGLARLEASVADSDQFERDEDIPAQIRQMAGNIKESETPIPPLLTLSPDSHHLVVLEQSADRIGQLSGGLATQLLQVNETLAELRSTVARIEKQNLRRWVREEGADRASVANYQASTYRTLARKLEDLIQQTRAAVAKLEDVYD